MAELLLRAIDNPGDPVVMYKTGDTVVVRPDGWSWGSQESLPPDQGGEFWIIKLPGTPVADVEHLVKPDVERQVGQGKHPIHVPDHKQFYNKRKFRLVIPPPIQTQLNAGPVTDPPGWQGWVQQKNRPV